MALDIKHTKTYTPFDPKDYISYVGRELNEASTLEANASLDVLPNFVESNVQGYYEIDLAKPDSYVLFPGQRTAIYNLNSINKIRDSAFNYFVVTREIEQLPVEKVVNNDNLEVVNIIPTITLVSDIGYANATNSTGDGSNNFRKYSFYAIQITDINRPIELFAYSNDPDINTYVQVSDTLRPVSSLLNSNNNGGVPLYEYGGGGNEGRFLEENGFIRKAVGRSNLYPFTVENNQYITFAIDSDYTGNNDITSTVRVTNNTYLVDNGLEFNNDIIDSIPWYIPAGAIDPNIPVDLGGISLPYGSFITDDFTVAFYTRK